MLLTSPRHRTLMLGLAALLISELLIHVVHVSGRSGQFVVGFFTGAAIVLILVGAFKSSKDLGAR